MTTQEERIKALEKKVLKLEGSNPLIAKEDSEKPTGKIGKAFQPR